jgi:hypothetical protein
MVRKHGWQLPAHTFQVRFPMACFSSVEFTGQIQLLAVRTISGRQKVADLVQISCKNSLDISSSTPVRSLLIRGDSPRILVVFNCSSLGRNARENDSCDSCS